MESSFVISGVGLSKEYALDGAEGGLKVLKNVTIELSKGELLAIVGPSGSGKSTLLHLLGGLDTPSSGKVYWDHDDIATLRDERLARMRAAYVGFVFQFHHLLPEFSAHENILLACLIAGASMSAATQRADELLEKFTLTSRRNHRPAEMSGGEQQRVAIARAIANRPAVLLADEPSGNLDSDNTQLLHETLRELNATEGQSIILVTHNEALAAGAHRVVRMVDGRLGAVRG